MKKILIILILIGSISLYKADLFTSSLKLCHLLKVELDSLNELEAEFGSDSNFSEINSRVENIRKEVPKSVFVEDTYDYEDCLDENSFISRFVTNPINSYTLIYRFSNLWPDIYTYINYLAPNSTFTHNNLYIPQSELQGVRDAIYRLGVFYMLEPEFLKNGSLSPEWRDKSESWSIVPRHLTATEIFEIGKIAFKREDFPAAKSWMMEALKQTHIEQSQENYELTFDILDHLSWSEYQLGEIDEAYSHCEKLVEINPHNERVKNNLKLFDDIRRANQDPPETRWIDLVIKTLRDKTLTAQLQKTFDNHSLTDIYYGYESSMSQLLCKYGYLWKQPPQKTKENKCYVKKGTHIYGKFITANVEQILTEPDAWILRDIANDEDIKHFKKLARDHLRTASVHNPLTGLLETADYRVSQSSWFDVQNDPIIRKMMSKIKVATGLTLTTTEDLQLANYGIGGYYDTHFDFARRGEPTGNNKLAQQNGGRLATFLLYMSDVPIGGRTGFHRLGTSVKPSKGDALFWYNLLPDGTGDARTRHIACPVVLGSKWVGNFWIRSRGEERSRPCGLTEQNGI